MKTILTIICLLLPSLAPAQNMSEQDMQKFMQKAMEAQACMEKIDQSFLRELEQESDAFEAELRKLCAEGKRDQARKKVMAFAKKMNSKPVIKEINRCNEMMRGVMPGGEMPDNAGFDMDFEKDGKHVCDELD